MVAKVNSGETIRGVLNYNENKVKEGTATCIDAVGFGCEPEDLSFHNKLSRFRNLTARNRITKRNAVHISLSFEPSEHFDPETLRRIAASYMEKIGFGDQPYLLYEHTDTHNQHIHIATVNIREDSNRIDLHYIGKNQSSIARREVESEFGLIRADGRKETVDWGLRPADLKKAKYGKVQTKAEISRIVRTVVKYYKFTSVQELNTLLQPLNVFADMGQPGTKMHDNGGLLYRLIDEQGKFQGIPIKSSSIYEKLRLKDLKERFVGNRRKREIYKGRLIRTINDVLETAVDKTSFTDLLAAEGIRAVFHENKDGHIYGVTYVDDKTYCVFKGSDLSKGYSAAAVLQRLQSGSLTDMQYNRQFVQQTLAETNFENGFRKVLRDWALAGMTVHAEAADSGEIRYSLGHFETPVESFLPADKQISAYLRANNFLTVQSRMISDRLQELFSAAPGYGVSPVVFDAWLQDHKKEVQGIIDLLLDYTYSSDYVPAELLREAKKKRKRKPRQ